MLSQQNVKISGLFSINLRVWWEGNGAEVSWDREKETKKRGHCRYIMRSTRTPASGTNRPQTMQSTTCVFAGTFWSRCWKSQCKGSDAINEPTCEKLAWLCRFFVSTQYSSQSCSPLVAAMFSWRRLFDLNHRCGPVMLCFLICSCRLPFFFSSLASRVSVTREAQSSYSSARCFTACIMGNSSSSVYL